MMMLRGFVVAASGFGIMMMSHDTAGATNSRPIRDVSVAQKGVDDHPVGSGAIITPVSVERAKNLSDTTISTFVIDYPPGASAVLHRLPSPGYVLVHVLSGTIRASAWQASVGTYRAGETWVGPAFAHGIATANPSDRQSARAFVILVAQDRGTQTDQLGPVE